MSSEEATTNEGPSHNDICGVVWRELVENLMRFVFASKETDANTGARLMAWGRCGPAIRNSEWVTVSLQLKTEGEGTIDTARVAKLLRISPEKVVYDPETQQLVITVDCGAETGSADTPTVAATIRNNISAEALKGTTGSICTSQSPAVYEVLLHKVTTSPYCTDFRLPSWKWKFASSGPSLPYEQKLVLRDEIRSFSNDVFLGGRKGYEGEMERDFNTELALRYTVAEVSELINVVKSRWQKHVNCFISAPCSIDKFEQDRTYAASIFEEYCYSSSPEVQKKILSTRHQLFTFLSTAIAEERVRRLKSLAVTVPFKGGPRKSQNAIRTDPKVTTSKQMTHYNKQSNRAFSNPISSNNPHRMLHRSVFNITTIGSSATAADLTLNCNLLRDGHPTKKLFNVGWDPYCCVRHTAHGGGGRGITNFAKTSHH